MAVAERIAGWGVQIALATWATFVEMAPYLLLGLTFAGILHVVFRKEFIVKHLGGDTFGSVVKAAALGVPLPLCSCGVIPTALSLRRSRASKGAVMSFLISTPQTGVDSIVATYGMMGPVFAAFRPIAALMMGIAGGLAMLTVERNRPDEPQSDPKPAAACVVCDLEGEHAHTLPEKVRSMLTYAYGSFLDDIAVQLLVGIAISGLITFLVPDGFFEKYVSNDLVGMALVILVGIPLYVCATASIPIAVSLMLKGLSPGVAFVFLAVGPATNAATITLVGNKMGRRFLVTYLGTMVVGAVLSGFALNAVYSLFGGVPMAMKHIHQHHQGAPGILTWIFVWFFAALMAMSLVRRFFPAAWVSVARLWRRPVRAVGGESTGSSAAVYRVEGMTCSHCAAHVREALLSVAGVTDVKVDLNGKTATVTGRSSPEAVRAAVREAGYTIVG